MILTSQHCQWNTSRQQLAETGIGWMLILCFFFKNHICNDNCFFSFCYIQYTIITLLTLLTLLTILLTTTYNIYNCLQSLRNQQHYLQYNRYLHYYYKHFKYYRYFASTTFFPSLSATFFFSTYKSLTRIAFHLFLKLAIVPFLRVLMGLTVN